jgi:hypothetical protein
MEMDSEPPRSPHTFGFAAIWAGVITVVCVLVGQSAVQFAKLSAPMGGGPLASARPDFRAIDYSATGSLKGQAIVINPCTGKQVGP